MMGINPCASRKQAVYLWGKCDQRDMNLDPNYGSTLIHGMVMISNKIFTVPTSEHKYIQGDITVIKHSEI